MKTTYDVIGSVIKLTALTVRSRGDVHFLLYKHQVRLFFEYLAKAKVTAGFVVIDTTVNVFLLQLEAG